MSEITIRRATISDITVLIDFQQKLASETENVSLDRDILQKGIKALFDDPSRGYYQVAEMDNKIVGCFMVTFEWSDWRNGWAYWLQSVYVDEGYRKHGIFKAMYKHLIEIVKKDPETAGLRLYVDKTNIRAQQVYSSMGMNGDHYTVFEWMK